MDTISAAFITIMMFCVVVIVVMFTYYVCLLLDTQIEKLKKEIEPTVERKRITGKGEWRV